MYLLTSRVIRWEVFLLEEKKKFKITTKQLAVVAICIALAYVASMIKFQMPQGGSVTAGRMFFICIIGYFFGPGIGILGGVASGLLDMTMGFYVVHPVQFIMDYILGFGVLGLSGFFRKTKYGLQVGYCVGGLSRLVCSWLSGAIFFAEYAGEQNAFIYSIIYNGSYIIPEMVLTLIIISVPAVKKAIDQVKKQLGQ